MIWIATVNKIKRDFGWVCHLKTIIPLSAGMEVVLCICTPVVQVQEGMGIRCTQIRKVPYGNQMCTDQEGQVKNGYTLG
jgi:hypothetical protein